MYIQQVNMTKHPNYSNSYRKNPIGLSFGHKVDVSLQQQADKLVEKYLHNFSLEATQYIKEGTSILQPQQIPLQILQNIALGAIKTMQDFPKNHKLIIITGRIGGGKSAFVEQNNLHKLFYTPDADEIKPFLPMYTENGSSYVHKVSCTINSTNISEALKRGINTIVQTATTIDNLDDIIDEAHDYNYNNIVMIHIDTNEENAIKRAMERGKLTGRTINPDIIKERKYIDAIVPTYKSPLKGLNQLIVYNNNGSSPIKVEDIDLNFLPEILTYVTDTDK